MNEPTKNRVHSRIVESGVVAVLRGIETGTAIEVAEALHAGGIDAIEVTADTPNAVEMIADLSTAFDDTEVTVGAGTVLDSETATATIRAGAEFVVSPTLSQDVIETANRYDAVSAPGVLTPTEALTAIEYGADLVKVFPAASVGPEYIASIRGPLDQLPIIPTGGVNLDNAAAFIEAGARAVGVGSALVDDEAIAAGDYDSLTDTARVFTETVEDAKANRS